jgi:hypothetical protein
LESFSKGTLARFETPTSQNAQKRTFCHTETAWHCGTDPAFEGQLVVAPSAPELPASDGEQAAAVSGASPCKGNGRGRRIFIFFLIYIFSILFFYFN